MQLFLQISWSSFVAFFNPFKKDARKIANKHMFVFKKNIGGKAKQIVESNMFRFFKTGKHSHNLTPLDVKSNWNLKFNISNRIIPWYSEIHSARERYKKKN